ncbi:succinate--CoA ligase subunit alpha [Thermofilum pendens]|uniref:Succinate--CoA ligase [ADP-forming] subunit alpha n=1 Tax=Thermofilum pendens (strain DSM 2475 / Hrk 5) TaxID=368408 RepID=A1RXJ3_THEPD|nr:succinate--CoA ligase subunit alpha [Thermofilum pendens]ABL77923.1 succinyl-CoA synthetase (ADP-forming) alpha subunit [Thermofilum pendens Hrk 5]
MAILVDEKTRVLVQGITGKQGMLHTEQMLRYGTRIVAGVTPGKGGSTIVGVPVYNTVAEAVDKHPEINTSIVFVPAPYAPDAVYEALDAGIKKVVVITEHIPVHETIEFVRYALSKQAVIIGPNTPGVISPGKSKVGIMPGEYFKPGNVGVVSRSGTLTYEVSLRLLASGFGVSTAVGIGGDPVTGLSFEDVYELFARDDETRLVVLVGEIGGTKEERFAEYYAKLSSKKPVVAFIAGKSAPPGRKMGHAGAIVFGSEGSYESKVNALRRSGIYVAQSLREIAEIVARVLSTPR